MLAFAVPDFDDEDLENLIGLFNADWGVGQLAELFDLPAETVSGLLDAHAGRRFAGEAPPAPPAAKPVRSAMKPRGARRGPRDHERPPGRPWGRPPALGEGLPAFAHHDRHVAAVMAQGGFAAFSERWTGSGWQICMPLVRPGLSVAPEAAS